MMVSTLRKFLLRFFSRPEHAALLTFLILLSLGVFVDGRIRDLLYTSAHNEVRNRVIPLSDELSSQIQRHITYLDALRTYLELDLSPAVLEERFDSFAAGLLAGRQGIQRFTLSPGGVIHYLYPPTANPAYLGTDLTMGQPDEIARAIQESIQTRQVVFSGPIPGTEANLVLICRVAVYQGDTYWGLAGEIVNLDPLLQQAGLSPAPQGVQLALRNSDGQVFWGNPQVFGQNAVILPMNLAENRWEMAIVPNEGWDLYISNQISAVRTLGMALIGFLTLVTHRVMARQQQLSGTVRERTDQLARQSEVRQQAEMQLRQSQAINAAVLENSMQGFLLVDRDHHVLLANQIMRDEVHRYLGKDIYPGDCLLDFLDDSLKEEYQANFAMAINGKAQRLEKLLTLEKGEKFWVDLSIYPVQIERGEIIGVCISVSDLTAYKQVEESLRQSEQRFEEIFQANPAAIAILSRPDGTILTMNASMETLLGYTSNTLFGREIAEFDIWTNGDDLKDLQAGLKGESASFTMETRWQTSLGEKRDVILSVAPIQLARQACLLLMVLDNTERKRIEAERERLFQEIQAGRERLRELTRKLVNVQEDERRRISRELHDEAGQALTALAINLEMLQTEMVAEPQEMHRSIGDSVELTHQTLDRIRSLAQNLRPPALDTLGLVPTLSGQCQMFHRRTRLPINTYFEDIPPLPETYNITFYRCLQEALTNVARHARARHVWVELRSDSQDYCLVVEDDGIGMGKPSSEEDLTGIFGMGLLGLQERLELLAGRLEIETRVGHGVRLSARLPKSGAAERED